MLTLLLLARLTTVPSPGPPACLTADALDPVAGAGASAVFEAAYGHCEGAAQFRVVQLWIGDEVTPAAARINLGYEAGMFFIEGGGACAPGDPVVLHSTLGGLDCAASSVTLAGNQATVQWAVEFDTTAFAGSHGVFFDAKGGVGDPEPRLGWTQMGTFIVEPDATDSGSTGAGATTGGGTGTSSGGDEGSGSSEGSDASTAGGDTEGTIPGGGGGRRGGVDGCACSLHGRSAGAWWLVWLLALWRRRSAHSQAGRARPSARASTSASA
jgi:hypothetical protein